MSEMRVSARTHGPDTIRVSFREIRNLFERLVQWKQVDAGMIQSVAKCGIASLGLDIIDLDDVEGHLELLSRGGHPTLTADGRRITIDGAGRHAWHLAEPLLDLAVDAFRREGAATVDISNVLHPELLRILPALAEAYDLTAVVETDGSGAARVTLATLPAESVIDLYGVVRRESVAVNRAQWFKLFSLSSNALAEDTVLSRTHTGAYVVNADGTILGNPDAEAIQTEDLSLFTKEKLEIRR